MVYLQRLFKQIILRNLRRCGYNIYRMSESERTALARYDAQLLQHAHAVVTDDGLKRLQTLRRRYAAVRLPVAQHSVWSLKGGSKAWRELGWGGVDLDNFRSHSAYVWGYAGSGWEAAKLKYFLFADTALHKDEMGLLKKMTEDGAFGCMTFEYEGIGRVSRDLLESVIEINFLQKHVNILETPALQILDIGAGYGRMAHRMLESVPNIKNYTCVDAVPESTFLCEFYLRYRALGESAHVIPLDHLEAQLDGARYDLALNIHSFSECTYAAVEWWLKQLNQMQVRYLMIVPNRPSEFLSVEVDRTRRDFAPLLKEYGYEMIASEAVFDDPAVQSLMNVEDVMYLFELR